MYRIIAVLFFMLSSHNAVKAQNVKSAPTELNKKMIYNFEILKLKLFSMDLSKKSKTDSSYLESYESMQRAFDILNNAYLATKPGPDTIEFIGAATKASIDLAFFRTPIRVLNQADEENCFDTWFELKSSKELDPSLFLHFKIFLKNRCNPNWLPGINEP